MSSFRHSLVLLLTLDSLLKLGKQKCFHAFQIAGQVFQKIRNLRRLPARQSHYRHASYARQGYRTPCFGVARSTQPSKRRCLDLDDLPQEAVDEPQDSSMVFPSDSEDEVDEEETSVNRNLIDPDTSISPSKWRDRKLAFSLSCKLFTTDQVVQPSYTPSWMLPKEDAEEEAKEAFQPILCV